MSVFVILAQISSMSAMTLVGPRVYAEMARDTYGELGAWVVDHALAVAGPVRETYLVGPRDTADAAAWRTEIGWPVFTVAGR